jgi:hypothetical protein
VPWGRPRFRSKKIPFWKRRRILRAFYQSRKNFPLKIDFRSRPAFRVRIKCGHQKTTAPPNNRQRAWQRRKLAAGNCLRCAKPRDLNPKTGKLFYYCAECRAKIRPQKAATMRQRRAAGK